MRGFRPTFTLVSLVVALVAWMAPRPAAADAKKDIEAKVKEAMENYDLFEYEEARKLLNTALVIAKKNKLLTAPIVAKVHLDLGIVYFAGLKDEPSARLSFSSAVEIDPKIQIEAAYRSPEMAKLLEEARVEFTGGGTTPDPVGTPPPSSDGVDCATVTGLQHEIVEDGTKGTKRALVAYLGADVTATKVVIFYRAKGKETFSEAPMTKDGCKYSGAIPANAMNGDLVHYYIAAVGANGRNAASKGTEGSPNIVEIAEAAGGEITDTDNPLDETPTEPKKDDGPKVSGGVVAGGKKSTVYLAVGVGTGAGYVSGETEQQRNPVDCCIAPGYLVVHPEIGYQVSRKLAIGVAGRIGFPIGANIEGHASLGPAGVLKLRYALSRSGNGFQISGSAGGGIIRNTVKLAMPEDPAQDVDIVAIGPLLVGAGAGYSTALGSMMRFTAELNALAGIPVTDTIGESHLNFGVQFDFVLGLGVGF